MTTSIIKDLDAAEISNFKVCHPLGNKRRNAIAPDTKFDSINITDVHELDFPRDKAWYLRLDRLDKVDSMKGGVYLSHHVDDKLRLRGPVLGITQSKEQDEINIFFERQSEKDWYVIIMDAKKYHLPYNLSNETKSGMIGMGFLPLKFDLEKDTLLAEQIISGFQMVTMVLDKQNLLNSRSHIMSKMMVARNLGNVPLPKSIVFLKDFSSMTASNWCDQKQLELSQLEPYKERSVPEAEANVVKKRKQSGSGSGNVASSKRPKIEKDKELAIANKSVESMLALSKYYVYGLDFTVDLPVAQIVSPPADYCHRPMNESHVITILKMMLSEPTHTPQVAEVVVWDVKRGAVNLRPKHKNMFADPNFLKDKEFWAISGQHSSAAQKSLCEKASLNPVLRDIARRNEFRKCKIISALAPKEILVQISMKANRAEDETKFKSCFCETVNHAREQFVLFKKPGRALSGKKNTQSFIVSFHIAFCFLI